MIIALILVNIVAFYLVRSNYYSSVYSYMQAQANILTSILNRGYEDTGSNTSQLMRQLVENFDKKETLELMAINLDGDVALTSSGFSLSQKIDMPDFEEAIKSDDGTGSYTGSYGREKIMAYTVLVQSQNNAYSAIRLVSSLDKVNSHINTVITMFVSVSAAIILIVFLSGMYFIKSIIIPLRQIGATAGKLAQGDFTVRIKSETDDEIGDLCTVFNHMADELENSETIKNDFISSVSHELRTPLTAIKGWSETLVEENDPETAKKGMRVIAGEAHRLSSMVEELLDFSRIQSGRFTLEMTNMDVLAELGEAVLIYSEKARKDGVRFIYEEIEEPAIIFGDKNRIRQVFINIIDNALKYTDSGGKVEIDVVFTEKDIKIIVSDSGIGISESDLPRVKTKFYKANMNRRGSGIGLAVADEIIQLHKGSLNIDSEVGKGTTVTILLPLAKASEHERMNDIEQ
ncbi:MAG: HAMP domain-containing histidine kinase [Clostridiales bacterium]|nr:HAMP domain-containing histidine kinase [Clostridiales bacterium]